MFYHELKIDEIFYHAAIYYTKYHCKVISKLFVIDAWTVVRAYESTDYNVIGNNCHMKLISIFNAYNLDLGMYLGIQVLSTTYFNIELSLYS